MHIKRYKELFKESIYIDKPESFETKFGVSYEDLDDYLTELSDTYIVNVFENRKTPRYRTQVISMKKVESLPMGFTICISNCNSALDEDRIPFNKNEILRKMESVCNRLKIHFIEFQKFNIIESLNGYIAIEYIFKSR
jgi:hypothetical protein